MLGAVYDYDIDIVKFVLTKVTWDESIMNPLIYAVQVSCIETVRFLVEEGFLELNDTTKESVLRNLLCSGTLEIVKHLISKGCDIYIRCTKPN